MMKSVFGFLGLFLATWFLTTTPLYASGKPYHIGLTGSAEIPGPGDPDGMGTAQLTLNQGKGEVCYRLEVSDLLLPATGAHIHLGTSDEAGPVVVGLNAPDESGVAEGCVEVDKEMVKEIRQNAANYYVNVHTSEYPAGAVRGQLE